MLVGNDHRKLQDRISRALCSGQLLPWQAEKLHSFYILINRYGRDTSLTEKQARFLFTTLANFERNQTKQPIQPVRPSSSKIKRPIVDQPRTATTTVLPPPEQTPPSAQTPLDSTESWATIKERQLPSIESLLRAKQALKEKARATLLPDNVIALEQFRQLRYAREAQRRAQTAHSAE
jgi:hypothetical protein